MRRAAEIDLRSGSAAPPQDARRVAIVHERFTELGGSERVVEQLHSLWPDAVVHAAVIDRRAVPRGMAEARLCASPLQHLYRGGRRYAHLLPLIPMAMQRLDLRRFDLVICSHHAFANRVQTGGATVVSYTHTPARWIWEPRMRNTETGRVLGHAALGVFARTQRSLDAAAARRVHRVVVNSRHVAERVRRWWGLDAHVVPPPVAIDYFTPGRPAAREDFFLLAGRLVPYKCPEVAVAAAVQAGVRLLVAGDGRARSAVEAAAGRRVELLGEVDDSTLRELYRRCQALVFPGEEDFGIVPVEAQACGTPIVARRVGGVLDSVVDGVTGTLYRSAPHEVDALAGLLRAFDPGRFDPAAIRSHAEQFAPERFRERFLAEVEDVGRPMVANP